MNQNPRRICSTYLKIIIPGVLDGLVLGAGIIVHPVYLIVGVIFFALHWRYLDKCDSGNTSMDTVK